MPRVDTRFPELRERRIEETLAALGTHFEEQGVDVTARQEAGLAVLLATAWDARLAEVMFTESRTTAHEVGLRVARAFDGLDQYDPTQIDDWLRGRAEQSAKAINDATRQRLEEAEGAQGVAEVMTALAATSASKYATSAVASVAGFASMDAGRATGASAKVWRTNSGNPRSSHRAVNGEAVAIDDEFRNGMEWPGDWSGGPAQVINCQCSLTLL